MPPWLHRKGAVLLLLCLTALFYWKLIFNDSYTFLDSPDLMGQVAPWYNVQAQSWHDGEFPLWDPYVWGGQPLLGQMQPGGAFPFNWPLFLAPLDADGRIDMRLMSLHFGLIRLLPGLFFYLLARELGCRRFSALLAGLAYACGGYISTIGWPQMLHGAIWFPLTLYFLLRFVRMGWSIQGVANAILCGGSIGFSLLSGHHQTPFFSLIAVTGAFAWLWWKRLQESRADAVRLAAMYGATAATAFLVAALQLLPAVEYGRLAYRWVNAAEPVGYEEPVPYFVHEASRLFPITLFGAVVPRAYFQTNTQVGWVCLALAILAIVTRWPDRKVQLGAILTVGGLAVGFGPFSPLHGWLYEFVPLAEKARTGAHAVFVFQAGVFLLAALGVERLLDRDWGEVGDQCLNWTQKVLLAFAALTWALLYAEVTQGKMEAAPGDHMMISALIALLLAVVVAAYRRGAVLQDGLRFGLIALMLTELYTPQWHFLSETSDPERREHFAQYESYQGAAAFIKQAVAERGEPVRFEVPSVDGVSPSNVGAWYGIEQSDGFLASANRDLFDLFGREGWPETRSVMGTRYTIAKEPTQPDQIEVYNDANWSVFENPSASPRAWVAHSLTDITGPNGEAATRRAEPCPQTEEQSVRFEERTMGRTLLKVNAGCRGFVVLTDPWYPGWEAEVDGELVPVYRYKTAFRAAPVPAGESTVRFAFRPSSVYWGAVLTGAGWLICIGAAFVAWRPRRSQAS